MTTDGIMQCIGCASAHGYYDIAKEAQKELADITAYAEEQHKVVHSILEEANPIDLMEEVILLRGRLIEAERRLA